MRIVASLLLASFATCAAAADEQPPAFTAPVAAAPSLEVAPAEKDQRKAYIAIVRREAEARGLPPEVAEAVAYVESRFNPSAVGAVGEIGLMQIRPATAEMLGHDGGALGLFDPETNARFSVRYLAEAWRLAGGDLCRALMKYRAGHGAEWMSPLSASYCQRAKAYLATLGSPLADGAAPMPVMAATSPASLAVARRGSAIPPYPKWRPGPHSEADKQRYWSQFEARIKVMTAIVTRQRNARIKAANARLARTANLRASRD